MAKLKGKAKAAFLARMAKGRRKKAKSAGPKRTKSQPKRRKPQKVKSNNKPRKSMARKKTRKSSRRQSFTKKVTSGGIFTRGIVGKVVMGVGAAAVTGIALNAFAPQFTQIGKPVAALLAGGPIGAVGQVLLDGGLGNITGIFGGAKPVEASV